MRFTGAVRIFQFLCVLVLLLCAIERVVPDFGVVGDAGLQIIAVIDLFVQDIVVIYPIDIDAPVFDCDEQADEFHFLILEGCQLAFLLGNDLVDLAFVLKAGRSRIQCVYLVDIVCAGVVVVHFTVLVAEIGLDLIKSLASL